MSSSQTQYRLTGQQLDGALDALQKASQQFRLSRLEVAVYRALGMCVTVVTTSFVLFVSMASIDLLASGGRQQWRDVVLGLSAVALLVSGVLEIVLLGASQSVVLATIRQLRLLKRLGLSEVSLSAWKAKSSRAHTFAKVRDALVTIVGGAAIALSIYGAWRTPVVEGAFADGHESRARALMSLIGLMFYLLIGFTILVSRYVQQGRERLELVANADRLRETLASIPADDAHGVVVVPAAMLEKVAGIERAQIAKERAQAVVDGVGASDRGYSVVLTREAMEQKARLSPDQRLMAEELIDLLAAQAESSARTGSDALLHARSTDGVVEIDYHEDEEGRRIRIVSVRALHERHPARGDDAH